MNQLEVKIPSDIKYISDWVDYEIPLGKCIIDKGVTGCGFTEYCLTNKDNIILCSPRRLLLKNKVEQHPGDTNILYLENQHEKIAGYDESEQDRRPRYKNILSQIEDQKDTINYTEIQEVFNQKLSVHLTNCSITGQPIKLLVTYDSFKYVRQYLGDRIGDFKIVIDEFQSIFLDSSFKADTELEFSGYIEDCPNVCYLSATPMLEHYLDKLDDFKDLDMYVFVWSNYIEHAIIDRQDVANAYQSVKKVIEDFKAGKFPRIVDSRKKIYESHEAVIYLNSVTDIIKLINSCGLTPQNTDIICADTDKNRRKLKKIKFGIARPNTYENRHLNKMFTFCTRTVYLGADFYSDNATSYVMSNPNKEHLAIDIALDLPQIIGRQRLSENPWKNQCTLFFQLSKDLKTPEEIDKIIDAKILATHNILDVFSNALENQKSSLTDALKTDYAKNYIGIYKRINEPVFNNLVWVSETRFWQVTQQDYFNKINVRRAIDNQFLGVKDNDPKNIETSRAVSQMNSQPYFEDKMKTYCQFCDTHPKDYKDLLDAKLGTTRFSSYYLFFGTQGMVKYSYREALLKREIFNSSRKSDSLPEKLDEIFIPGNKYTLKEIKESLGKLYDSFGITSLPKASDLEKYFEIKESKITINKKREHAYLIISKK